MKAMMFASLRNAMMDFGSNWKGGSSAICPKCSWRSWVYFSHSAKMWYVVESPVLHWSHCDSSGSGYPYSTMALCLFRKLCPVINWTSTENSSLLHLAILVERARIVVGKKCFVCRHGWVTLHQTSQYWTTFSRRSERSLDFAACGQSRTGLDDREAACLASSSAFSLPAWPTCG